MEELIQVSLSVNYSCTKHPKCQEKKKEKKGTFGSVKFERTKKIY